MYEAFKTARRRLRVAKFERDCRVTLFGGRRIKAYRAPGTQEAGRYSMILQAVNEEAARIRQGEPGIYAKHSD